ncbi:MAG: hypothetical protein CMD26_04945 [Flavobacteriales bacterium]|nr:hypothetical protein [Flavobacteriales bacterium]
MKTKYRSIILLLISIISATIAQGLSVISIPWYFTDILEKSSVFTLGYSAITFFGLIWGLYAGVIIDNYNRKKILIYINLSSTLLFALLGIYLVVIDPNSVIAPLIGFGACSFYYIVFFPNLYAIIKEFTSKKDYIKINSIVELFIQSTNIISATLCGILLSGSSEVLDYFNLVLFDFEEWSVENIFLLNSIMYFITFGLLLFVKYHPERKKTIYNVKKAIKEVQLAIKFLKKNQDILIYAVCSQIVFAFLIVELFALLPLFIKNCLNENVITFALADVTYGFGAILAGFTTVILLRYYNKLIVTIILIIIAGYAFTIMVEFQQLIIFFICSFLIGVANASIRITRMSYFFDKIPNNLMGRTNTIFNSINTLIRGFLILLFSISWFTKGENVIIGYKIGVIILILFSLPLIITMLRRKLY